MTGPSPSGARRARAVVFDYNGTLSDDEALLERIYLDVLDECGAAIDAGVYRRELAGLPDHDMVARGLALGGLEPTPALRQSVLRERLERYGRATADVPTIHRDASALVRRLAGRVPLAVASGALRSEIDAGLARAGLADAFAVIVSIEDVAHGKPHPETFALAARLLAGHVDGPLLAADVLAIEDTDVGIQAARAAGLRCVALTGPAYTGTPVEADAVIGHLHPGLADVLVGAGHSASARISR